MKKIQNNPQLTAKERTSVSFPTRWLQRNKLLQGEILDFGCGFGFDVDQLQKEGFNIVGTTITIAPNIRKNALTQLFVTMF